MEKYDNNKLRSTQFPYHLTNAPNLSKLSKSSSLKKVDYKYDHLPTTYMVVNFDDDFAESVQSEMPPITKVDQRKTQAILAKLKKNSPGKLEKLPKAPNLVSSYILPKKFDPDAEAKRLMFRRTDAGTQTELNMNKMVFEGLTGYQAWTSDVVEPFLKVSLLCATASVYIVWFLSITLQYVAFANGTFVA